MIRILCHGGAGTIPDEYKSKYAEGIRKATQIGYELLSSGSPALEAVEASVKYMEEDGTFNAGRGSVLTYDERIEMDAMIMDGSTLRIGGVMGLENYLHPISISRAILEHDKHIFYAGQGADIIAKKYGFQPIDPHELVTERTRKRLKKFKEEHQEDAVTFDPERRDKYGTVGAVALDSNGLLASATSTGGILGKNPGRIGDTPIPGAGTYADTNVAISATGTGEFIIRSMLGFRIVNHYTITQNVYQATVQSLREMKMLVSGQAGVITLSKSGDYAALHSTRDLCYAYSDMNGKIIDFTMEDAGQIYI